MEEVVFDDDTRRVVALLVGGGLLRSPKVVRWSSVANIADIVAVRAGRALEDLGSDPEVAALRRRSREGKEIITEEGEKVGEVSDLFVGHLGEVLGYEVKSGLVGDLLGRKFLPIEGVRSSGGDVVASTVKLGERGAHA